MKSDLSGRNEPNTFDASAELLEEASEGSDIEKNLVIDCLKMSGRPTCEDGTKPTRQHGLVEEHDEWLFDFRFPKGSSSSCGSFCGAGGALEHMRNNGNRKEAFGLFRLVDVMSTQFPC